MHLIVIPPGGAAKPHYHMDAESAIYLIEGKVKTRYGKDLNKSVINKKGNFIYIPEIVPHHPVNLSETEPAYAIAHERMRIHKKMLSIISPFLRDELKMS